MNSDNLSRSATTLRAIVVLGLACLAGPLSASLQAQTAADARAIDIVRHADLASAHEGKIPSRETFERALAAAIAHGDRATEAMARRGIGVLLRKQARYAEARTELLSALQIHETLGDRGRAGWTRHHLGWVAFDHETSAAADEHWTRGLADMQAAGDRRGEVQLLHNRTFVMPPGPERDVLLQRVLELAREIGDERTEAGALYRIGSEQLWAGNYAASLQTLQQALAGFERVGSEHSTARVLLRLGQLHSRHGELRRAEQFYARAARLLRRLGDKMGIAEATGIMATLHYASGRLQQAAATARHALALAIESAGPRDINLARIRLARLSLELGDARKAKALLDDVMYGPDAFTRDLAYEPLSEVHLALSEYQEARDAADLAARTTREPAERPFMLTNRARADDKLGHSSQALASVEEALQIVEQVRQQLVPTDPMKQGYAERVQRLFAFAVDLRARLGRHQAALEAAEQARARAFLDLLAARDASRPGSHGNAPELPSAVAAVPLSVAQLADEAGRLRSTILTYWVGPERTIVWVIDAGGLVHTAIVPAGVTRLTRLVSQTWRGAATIEPVAGGDASLFVRKAPSTRAWRVLNDLLIRPVREHLPATGDALLTIIPHGPLSRLSFAALRDERGRYLVERYALHYVPAGAVLAQQRAGERPPAAQTGATYLLVANPAGQSTDAGGRRLSQLPGAVGEIRRISRLLRSGSVVTLTGTSAREDRVRELMPGSRVMHFATHAVLRDDRPLDSFLALGRAGAQDGQLKAQEIYDLMLDADLVVLSACRTASGPVTGDGIVGLTRAFFYAGTPSVVATLWDLADESGREVLPAFYRAWLNGDDKARALRAAQFALLSRLRARRAIVSTNGHRVILEEDPFLWAGFVVVGEP